MNSLISFFTDNFLRFSDLEVLRSINTSPRANGPTQDCTSAVEYSEASLQRAPSDVRCVEFFLKLIYIAEPARRSMCSEIDLKLYQEAKKVPKILSYIIFYFKS